MRRKDFLKTASPLFLLLVNGNVINATKQWDYWMKRKPILRFALVSDIHYGEPKTDYNMFLKTLIWKINTAHSKKPLDFCVLNGDIVHDDPKFYPSVKPIVGQLKMKWHVTPGNHDKITPDEWMQIWDTPVNFDFRIKNSVFLAGTTSNEKENILAQI